MPQARAADVSDLHAEGKLPHDERDPGATEEYNGSAAGDPDGAAFPSLKTDWPKPLGAEALRGIVGDFVRILEPHTEADPTALAVQFLVAFGNAAGRGPHQRVEDTRHGLNENAVIVGKTGRSRKGTSGDRASGPVGEADPEWAKDHVIPGGLSSGEGLIYHVRDGEDGDGSDDEADPGVIDKRLHVVETEFASVLRVMKRETNTLSAVLRNAWDGKQLRTLTRGGRGKAAPLRATNTHVSVIGHITLEELTRTLDAVEMSNGFANRFPFFLVKRSKELPEGGRPDLDALSALNARVADALRAAKRLDEMTRDLRARELWRAEYPRLTRDVPGMLGSILARSEAHVLRFSGIYAALEMTSTISSAHLQGALELWRYAEDSARVIFGIKTGDPVADEILTLLRQSPDGVDREAIRNHFQRHQSSERLSKALDTLARAGLARKRPVATGGRPAEVWEAIPADARKAT